MGTASERTNARPGWTSWIAIAVGGAVGTGLRLLAEQTLLFPLGLALVNTLGAIALLVLLLGVWPRAPRAPRWLRDGLGIGVLGAFTTLSGVSLAFAAPGPTLHIGGPMLLAATIAAGVVGTLLRHGAVLATVRLRPRLAAPLGVPLGILLVNVVGSLIAGLTLGALLGGRLDPGVAVIVIAGACGGLTTFSTVIAEAVRSWLAGRPWSSLLIIAANLALGAAAAVIGLHA